MINKVLDFVKKQHMFDENDYVVAGISGGADSVCLLFVLLEIRKIMPITIHAVHINHGIREEAHEDATYVQKLCMENNVAFTLVEEDVEALAKKLHMSSEEAGRTVRYKAFYQELREHDGGKIAIAHNMNDSCETFLFNLFRGSGLKGLSGISSVRDEIVRPLLCVDRQQIEAFLKERNISYCIDRTNNEDNYTRNRIRHHILPAAQELVSPRALDHIHQASQKISDAYELIEDMTKQGYDSSVIKDTEKYLIKESEFNKLHPTIQSYVLRQVVSEIAGSSKDIETVHIEQIMDLFDKQCGRQIDLPYNMYALRNYEGVSLMKNKVVNKSEFIYELSDDEIIRLECGEEVIVESPNHETLKFRIIKATGQENIDSKTYTKWFDYDTIKDKVVIRYRKSNDYLTINNQNQRQTLKAFFVNEKIPKEDRDQILLITEKSHCLWIVGSRISNYYKVTGNTKCILEIKYQGGNRDGRTC